MADDADLETLISNQRQELLKASAAHSDLDFAFHLQMHEAMTASLALHPSTSSSPPSPPPLPPPSSIDDDDDIQDLISLQTLEIDRFCQESQDNHLSQSEMSRISADLRRKIHDETFAREIDSMPEEDWEEYGDNYEKPMEAAVEEERPFRVYFKGILSQEMVRGKLVSLASVGAAVCDPDDRLVLKIQKPLLGAVDCPRAVIEGKALIEALAAAGTIGVKNVDVFFDYRALYNHINGRWIPKQRKVANLIDQILLQERKLDKCRMFLVPRCNIKYAFKLARDAIDSQMTRNVELSGNKDHQETCNVCLEDTDSTNMFAVDICLHRFCFSCVKQHVEVKLLHGMLPSCPQDGCKNRLNIESCRKFLSPKLLDIMVQRIKEASIPVTEKLYCPYPKCSALMSISEALCPQQESSSNRPPFGTSGLRNCIKCNRPFCLNCKVPWHDKLSCYDYKRLNPQKAEDLKLKVLARQNLWRQCVKCNHMIELAEGCFHMTCRCGYEFCYTCGAEWKNKKATCSCPLWVEDNILYDDTEDEDDNYYAHGSDDDAEFFDDDEEDNYYF